VRLRQLLTISIEKHASVQAIGYKSISRYKMELLSGYDTTGESF
jgi:hypothetical protein